MGSERHALYLVADFNAENLAGYLINDPQLPSVSASLGPFDQVPQTLSSSDPQFWLDKPNCLVWTRPEAVSARFAQRLRFESVTTEAIIEEVEQFANLLVETSARVKSLFVPTWCTPTHLRGLGLLDMRADAGIAHTLMRMNLRLAEGVSRSSNLFLLNTQKWVEEAGANAFNPKLWYLGKIAFGNKVFAAAAADLKAALLGIEGAARKLIVVDLDNTLWGDVVGEVGWEQIQLGGHDPAGEAFADFQRGLKALSNRGILLAIVSKNEEAVALEAIRRHPEMKLSLEDFAGWRINWNDKAQNLVELAQELNVGLEAAVFIDDQPAERDRIRQALPEVLVPDWPGDWSRYASALASLNCFDVPAVTSEDGRRTQMYAEQRQRKQFRTNFLSLQEWLDSLDLTLRIEELNESNLMRAAQLLNKTNQLNMSCRRLTGEELRLWAEQPACSLWTYHVSDRFGDSGLTGLSSLLIENGKGQMVDFLLSCRVMGRGVEEAILHHVAEQAQERGMSELFGDYVETERNAPCRELLGQHLTLCQQTPNRYVLALPHKVPTPTHIRVVD